MKLNFLMLLIVSSLFHSFILPEQRTGKVLVLIIASEEAPVYVELQKIWRSYMHLDPEHIEAYFIKGDITLPHLYEIKDDIIWSRVIEGWTIPGIAPFVLNKTIYSLEAMLPRLNEFDYVLRTNLSSFYVFPRLLEFVKNLPLHNCYCGSSLGDNTASGCGFLISSDLAKLMVAHKDEILKDNHQAPDDCIIGRFLTKKGIKLIPHARFDLVTLDRWQQTKDNLPHHIFQFRVKNDHPVRIPNDLIIQSGLLKQFYGINY